MVRVDDLHAQSSPLDGQSDVPRRLPGQSRKKVLCLSCGKPGVFVETGPNRSPAWLCVDYPNCDSYVGCHPGSQNALGSMAGPSLRAARVKAHGWIDRLWRGKKQPTRKEVYQVISQLLGLKHFHVAQADQALLEKLDSRRKDVDRAFDRLVDSGQLIADKSPSTVQQSACELVSEADQVLFKLLFATATRRRWPADPGGQVAAQRCLLIGLAQASVDAAGRRWISKKQSYRDLT